MKESPQIIGVDIYDNLGNNEFEYELSINLQIIKTTENQIKILTNATTRTLVVHAENEFGEDMFDYIFDKRYEISVNLLNIRSKYEKGFLHLTFNSTEDNIIFHSLNNFN